MRRWIGLIFAVGIAASHGQQVVSPPPPVPDVPNSTSDWLDTAEQEAGKCQQDGGEIIGCYIDASPKRCKAAAVAMVTNPALNRRTWGLCVESCANSGFIARTFGDCSK